MKFGPEENLPDPLDGASALDWAHGRAVGRPASMSLVARRVDYEEVEAEDSTFNLLHYWNLALKYRWLLVCALALGLAAGVVATLLTTPVYQASATVQIDEEPAKVVAVESERPAQPNSAEKFYQTQYELLKSRALAQRVVANENLAYNERFLNQWDKPTVQELAERASRPKTATDRAERTDKAAGLVSDQLQIEPVRLSRIVKISYDSPDPVMAAKIANAVAANYIKWNLERRYEASSAARRFLEERLEQTRQTLEEAQKRGNEYAQANQLITVEGAGDASDGTAATGESLVATDLATVNAQLANATAARIQVEQRWRQAGSTKDMALPEILSNPAIQSLKSSRDQAWSEYQQNLRVYKPDWPAMIDARKKIEGLDQQIAAQVGAIRNTIRTELEVARRNEAEFQVEVNKRKQELLDSQSKRVEQSFINTDINTSKSLYDGMLASYKQIGLAGGIGDNNISFVDRAEIPGEAVKPQARDNLIRFGLLGLALGALLAFLLDRFDLSVKAPADVEKDLRVPLLGVIPIAGKDLPAAKAIEDPKSHLSEAYYSVRTALQFSTENGTPSSILVSSSRPAEGKTSSSLALATGFARLGQRVLLIDGDMRDPSLHKILGRDNGVGLSNLLAGGPEMIPTLQPTNHKNLTFLACGPLPPNPAELLGGGRMRSFLAAARNHFDVVVIDGPPVMGLADAPQMANIAAGVIFVVAAGETKRDLAKAAIRRLRVGNVHILGAVLTKFDTRKAGHGHGYGYGYDYGSRAAPARRPFGFMPLADWFGPRARRA